MSMDRLAAESLAPQRVVTLLLGVFAGVALILAAVGIYGVVAYTAGQRTHEIGIRMALGAAKGDIFRTVLEHGLRLTVMGLVAGLAASLFLTRFVRTLLYGVGATDWMTYATVSVLLCVVAVVA